MVSEVGLGIGTSEPQNFGGFFVQNNMV